MTMIKFTGFDDDLKEEVLAYTGKNSDIYEKRWISMSRRNSIASWHWPAFFANCFWAAYRRLYIWVYVYFVITTIINFIPTTFLVDNIINVIDLGVGLAFAICANYIYLKQAVNRVTKLRELIPDRKKRLEHLESNNGYSKTSFWIFFAIFVVSTVLSFFF